MNNMNQPQSVVNIRFYNNNWFWVTLGLFLIMIGGLIVMYFNGRII